jgi:hypothetical protein
VQCAEIAAMDNDNLDDEFDDETEAEAGAGAEADNS